MGGGGRTWAVLDKTLRRGAAGPIGQLQLPRGGSAIARIARQPSSRCGDGGPDLLKSVVPPRGGSWIQTEQHYGAPLCRFLATLSRTNLPLEDDTCHRAFDKHDHPRRPILPLGGVLFSHGDLAPSPSSSSSSFSSFPFFPSSHSSSSSSSSSVIHQVAGGGIEARAAETIRQEPSAHGRRLLPGQALRIAFAGGAQQQRHSVRRGARVDVSSSPYSSASAGSDDTAAADQAGKEAESRSAAAGTKPGADGGKKEQLEKDELIALLMEQEKVVVEKEEMIGSLKDTVLRSYADMENLRERTRREVDSIRRFAVQDFAKALLDVADNLERAMSVIPKDFVKGGGGGEANSQPESDPAKLLRDFAVGVDMTEKQLGKVLKKYGIEKYDPIGHEFNPNEHQAMFEVDQSGEGKEGNVAIVTKVGYKIFDRVLRPAEVGVYKQSASSSSSSSSPSSSSSSSSSPSSSSSSSSSSASASASTTD